MISIRLHDGKVEGKLDPKVQRAVDFVNSAEDFEFMAFVLSLKKSSLKRLLAYVAHAFSVR